MPDPRAERGASVVSVDYRVAPEHPFPVPLDDCWDALRWVAAGLTGEQWPLLVGGDSAGGNMAAVCARRARDAGGPPLLAQILVYPVTDHDMTTPSYLEHGANEELLLEGNSMRWFWDNYAPDESSREHPDASPLRAQDLSGLAPAIVVIAEYDPLRDEGLAYAQRLRDAGVEVSDAPLRGHAARLLLVREHLPDRQRGGGARRRRGPRA